jgi:hypothetical protein
MRDNDLILYGGILTTVVVIALYLIWWYREKQSLNQKIKSIPVQKPAETTTLPLKLQAYERLVLLAERIALPNLITRVPSGDFNVREYQHLLIEQIKAEFDHNLSQQIYVSPTAWSALGNLKEQNIFIINSVAQALPGELKGNELSRKIADLLNVDPKASMHTMVLEAINHEAKKLL